MIRRLRDKADELAALVVLLAIVSLLDPDEPARRRPFSSALFGHDADGQADTPDTRG